jgi:hypothetical protein
MGEREFSLATFLDPQGKLESYGWLVKDQNRFSYLGFKKNGLVRSILRGDKHGAAELSKDYFGHRSWF